MKNIQSLIKIGAYLLIIGFIFQPGYHPVRAAEFDPSFILANEDIEDYSSMNLNDIQSFLSLGGSSLASYIAVDIDGFNRFASEIIYNAAQKHRVNPKWILVTLQKEQSLINDPATQKELDWAMGYGVCDDCSKDDPGLQKFKGFSTQIDRATARIRYYLTYPEQFNFQPGETVQIDDLIVTIKNRATALLYNYTPHINGNRNFWKLWSRWFTKGYPDGTLLQVEGEPGVWVLQSGQRRALMSRAILKSLFGDQKIILTTPTYINRYDIGLPVIFPNYSLVRSSAGETFMLVNNEKRKLASDETFRLLGFNPDEVEMITDEYLATYFEGRQIEANASYPIGQLLQDSKTGGVYFVENGFKYPIVSRDILNVNFPGMKPVKVSPADLEKYLTGQKVKFRDGSLIKSKSEPSVYVISNGERRTIANENTFNQLGYKFKDVVDTNEAALSIHPLGEILDVTINASPVAATIK